MNHIERIIDFMVKRQGQRFTMQSDDNCFLHTAGGRQPLNRLMTGAEIEAAVQEVLPPHLQPHLTEQGTFSFPYDSSHGTFTLQVTRRNGSVRVLLWQGDVMPEDISDLEEETSLPSVPTPPEPTEIPVSAPSEPEALPPAPEPEPSPAPIAQVVESVAPHYLPSLFRRTIRQRASDLHLRADAKPFLRIREEMQVVTDAEALNAAHLAQVLWQIAPERCPPEWAERGETCFGYDFQNHARFRCHVFREHHGIAATFRLVPSQASTIDQLGLPEVVKHLAEHPSGIVVVSGRARAGRSTTVAAMVEHINRQRSAHIITVEEPIEFVHRSMKSLITQCEIPTHFPSPAAAWAGLRRMDADVCVIGELRDFPCLSTALNLVEQGCLVFATASHSHTSVVVASLLHQCPPAEREEVSLRLVRALKGVIAQTLCCDTQGGQVAAVEVLVMTSPVAARIREGNFGDLEGLIWSRSEGMVSLNDSLLAHVQSGRITLEEARRKSLDPDGLKRLLQ